MGWASGTELAQAVIESAKRNIRNKDKRDAFYYDFYCAMSNLGWDGEYETLGLDPLWDELMAANDVTEEAAE